jgi:predicted Rossmann fold nucleotide-binding protein DprA/Smf involved in DNA uptake
VRVAIVGSRRFPALEEVEDYVRSLPNGSSLVTGSASGVDAAATRAARARGLHVQVVAASFDELRDAQRASERNRRLVGMSDVLVAFWDGRSEGTRRTIENALDAGKEVHVFTHRA